MICGESYLNPKIDNVDLLFPIGFNCVNGNAGFKN